MNFKILLIQNLHMTQILFNVLSGLKEDFFVTHVSVLVIDQPILILVGTQLKWSFLKYLLNLTYSRLTDKLHPERI